MAKLKDSSSCARTVDRRDFAKDPSSVIRQARNEGPIVITDSNGKPRGVLTVTTQSSRKQV